MLIVEAVKDVETMAHVLRVGANVSSQLAPTVDAAGGVMMKAAAQRVAAIALLEVTLTADAAVHVEKMESAYSKRACALLAGHIVDRVSYAAAMDDAMPSKRLRYALTALAKPFMRTLLKVISFRNIWAKKTIRI